MLDVSWVEELQQQARQDLQYWMLEPERRHSAVQLEALRQTMKADEQAILDHYLLLEKKAEVCLTRMAYCIGRQHGMAASRKEGISPANKPSGNAVP